MCTDRHDDDTDAIQKCRISESVELLTKVDITPKTETDTLPDSGIRLANLDAARPQYAVDDAFIKTPVLHEIIELLRTSALGTQSG